MTEAVNARNVLVLRESLTQTEARLRDVEQRILLQSDAIATVRASLNNLETAVGLMRVRLMGHGAT